MNAHHVKDTPRPKAVAYYRVSTAEQDKHGAGLDTQRRSCRERVEAWEWDLIEEFEDAGISGDDNTRPAWNRLLSKVQEREFDAVFVFNVDRWSRDIVDGFTARKLLERHGVALYESERSYPVDLASEEGYRDYTDDQVDAEKWKRKHLKRTVEGQREKGKRGEWPGGQPPYGWTLKGVRSRHATPIVDPRARGALAVAYDLLVTQRMNTQRVADRMNDLGLPTWATLRNEERIAREDTPSLTGPVKWNPAVLRRVLDNPSLYTGKYVFGAVNSGVKPGGDESLYRRSHHTKLKWDGTAKWGDSVELDLPEPPFTRQQWDAMHRALLRSSTRGKSAQAKSQMLTTRLVGACGKHYIGVSLKEADDVYRCSGRKHLRGVDKCICKQVNGPALDARVWAEVKAILSDPERLESMARLWLEVPEAADLSDFGPLLEKIDREIERKQRALSRALDDRYNADDVTEHDDRIARFRVELADMRQRRDAHAAIQAARDERSERLTDLVALAERARGRLDTLPESVRREIMQILDIRVSMLGDVVTRMPERVSEPEGVRIVGIIDPRLFGDNQQEDVGSQPGFADAQKPSQGVGWQRSDSPACWWSSCAQERCRASSPTWCTAH